MRRWEFFVSTGREFVLGLVLCDDTVCVALGWVSIGFER